ncbi:DMT family transporter [Tabrizicola sp. M-4]|uniref:DMT family transporter n=1 Tax=Tabrizicola sp. M-4 TaxID=3055847 RepID=UPI003DA7FD1A
MRLFLLTAVVMVAFAANSVLNRMAVGEGGIGAVEFALVRVLAGAGVLLALVAWRGRGWRGASLAGVAGLSVYLFGFSLAYGQLDAGTGALILFGVVQVTMFGGALLAGEAVPGRRWAGAGLALAGLAVLVAPAGASWMGFAAMAAAGLGWGVYSLAGRGARDALAATAGNFALALIPAAGVALLAGVEFGAATGRGVALAVLSGAVTSGLGYALWYGVLPALGAGRAAVAQLTVPLIAAAGGAVLMGEAVGWRFAVAAALVLGGVAWASLPRAVSRGGG